ncbi:similar to Saccharomyces cerevisiae YGR201C Putative protein of unknown function [Maudiozyma saulgeensis]|uniref:GST C-terminal domain-containing protein n=1 Tax=Maudiozyma saulgeensis TaxID=1789683 RepID=A0A1X7RAS0_9SACH|nr:similar to Saccharomyces cerevisiae YGR201C Putative protein of unknown function [Kazachstania saulgeensis]
MPQKEIVLYTHNEFIRPIVSECLIKYFKLNIEIIEITKDIDRYISNFPVKTVPALLINDNLKLFEQIAVTHYIIKMSNDDDEIQKLLGKNEDFEHQSHIDMICSFCTSDFLNELVMYCLHDLKTIPISEVQAVAACDKLNSMYQIFEEKLKTNRFLTCDEITLADLMCASSFSLGFNSMLGPEWRDEHPEIVRWYDVVIHSDYLKARFENFKYCDKAHRIIEQPLPWDN